MYFNKYGTVQLQDNVRVMHVFQSRFRRVPHLAKMGMAVTYVL